MEAPKLESLDKKKLLLLLGLVVVILLGCSFQYGRVLGQRQQAADLLLNPAEPAAEEPPPVVEEPAEPEPEPEPLLLAVHVKGAVAEPGLYELTEGLRVADALELAGLLEEANTDVVNLALPLADGMEVVVPFRVAGEETDWQALLESSGAASTAAAEYGSGGSTAASAYTGIVNINTDGLARLQSLEGIGAVKAQAIIDYREAHGPFARIEDITKVSGIGSATFEKIKDRISVE